MDRALMGSVLVTSCLAAVGVQLEARHSSPDAGKRLAPGEAVDARWTEPTSDGRARPQVDPASTVPISVLSVQMNSDKPTVTFVLQNTGAKAITAWHVSISIGDNGGGRGADAYRSFAGLTSDGTHIVPGGTIAVTAPVPTGTVASGSPAVITPTGAVFEDRSFAGDAKFADFVFQRRSAELAAWRQITGELEKARAGGPVDLTTLEYVLTTINGSPQNDGADSVRQTVRANLSLAISAVRAGDSPAASRLDGLLDDARRNLAAAIAHSRQ